MNQSSVPDTVPIPMPDFREPIPRMSINGFPTRFRRDPIGDNLVLWVPQRVTRNRRSRGWLIDIKHAHGRVRVWEGDRGRTPLKSLQSAWHRLIRHLHQLESPYINNRRAAPGGKPRIKALDTGVEGVLIARQRARNGRANTVSVRLFQRIETKVGASKPISLDTVHISESKYQNDPAGEQQRFEQGLCLAMAVRSRYLQDYAETGPLPTPIQVQDIEPETVPSKPVVRLDLGKVFDTFSVF